MNRKQLAILLVLVIVLGGAGLVLRKKQSASWTGGDPSIGKKPLSDLAVNDVTHLAIKQDASEVNLVKKDDLWRVRERNNYPANFSEISDFLRKIPDLKIVQSEKAGASGMARLALAAGPGSNSALVVEFKGQNDKTLKSLLLGKKHMKKGDRGASQFGDMGEEGWPDGRYVRVGAESDRVLLISDALANIEPKPDQWLNKDFFKIEKVRSIAVAFPIATNSWKLTRDTETADWKLADAKAGEQLDSSKASGVVNPLSSPSFTDVLTSVKPEETGMVKPTVVTAETFDNLTYTLKVGQKTNDNFPLAMTVTSQPAKERVAGKDEKPEDEAKLDKEFKENQKKLEEKLAQEKGYEKWVYLVSTWTVDPLLKERSQLMAEKKEEPKKDEKLSTGEPKTNEPKEPSATPPTAKPDAK
jgi:hypothetical protein